MHFGSDLALSQIIRTILKREYTFKKGSALVPTFTAFAVVQLMKEHLASLIDSAFTAKMEDRLDAIARGEEDALPYLREFYSGNGTRGLKPLEDDPLTPSHQHLSPYYWAAFVLSGDWR